MLLRNAIESGTHSPLFIPQNDGTVEIFFQCGFIPSRGWLIEMRDALNQVLSMDAELVKKHNDRIEKNIRRNATFPESWGEKPIRGCVYIIKSNGLYKIGRAKNLRERLKGYRTENPFPMQVIFSQIVDDYIEAEKEMLSLFPKKRVRGEWYDLDVASLQKIIRAAVKRSV